MINAYFPSPEKTLAAYALAAQFVDTFPKNGCAVALSVILDRQSLTHFGEVAVKIQSLKIEDNAQALAGQLECDGWVRIPKEEIPRPGDVMVSEDLNGNGMADHVALVCAGVEGRFFCWDNHLGWPTRCNLPYWRNTFKEVDGKTPVAYWLRPPPPQKGGTET